MNLLDDGVIDDLQVLWIPLPSPGRTRLDTSRPELAPLCSLVSFWPWKDLPFLAEGVLGRRGRSVNDLGFAFAAELDEAGAPPRSVQVFDPLAKTALSEGAFDRLILKFLSALRAGPGSEPNPGNEPWWTVLDPTIQSLRERSRRPG